VSLDRLAPPVPQALLAPLAPLALMVNQLLWLI
jgi:hypothetical protein